MNSSAPNSSGAPARRSRPVAQVLVGISLLALGSLLGLLLIVRPTRSIADRSAIPVAADYPAPQLNLQRLSGPADSLANYRGSLVLVNLWAAWCPPCRSEMPALQEFFDRHRSESFWMIAINQEETRDVAQKFSLQYGLTFTIWLDPEYLAQRLFHTAALPSSYVIDRSGVVRLRWVGAISQANLEKYVTPLLTSE